MTQGLEITEGKFSSIYDLISLNIQNSVVVAAYFQSFEFFSMRSTLLSCNSAVT